MKSETANVRFAAATACVLLIGLAVGCASRQPAVGASPAGGDGTRVAQGSTGQVPTPEPPRAAVPARVATVPVPELPDPELEEHEAETYSESPLDELAQASAPTLSAGELADERARAAARQPEFDIPIVINDQVLAWVDYYADRHRDTFLPGMRRSGRYLPMFRRIFAEEGLPLDLVYMAHVESAFKTHAYSRARAMGIWQFISSTAQTYGLKIDYFVDERRDPEKSARAAARYLKKLYGDFGDWHLAMAAYNGGEGRIQRALAKTGQDDFWGLAETRHLRRETRNYVPAILAVTLIHKDPAKYGIEYESEPPLEYDTVEVDGAADLQVLADCAGVDFDVMETLNPMLRRAQTPPNARTAIRVPPGRGAQTLAALERVPASERVLYVHHRVQGGDTLYDLARKYGVTVAGIQQSNALGGKTVIRAGQELLIPTVAAGRYAGARGTAVAAVPQKVSGEPVTYRVRRGDTLSAIARRYTTTPAAIAAASGIDVGKTLQIGERLTVVPGATSAAAATESTTRGATVASADTSATRQHRVRRGESLWAIAQRYSMTVDALCSLNAISQSATLYPGTLLNVAP